MVFVYTIYGPHLGAPTNYALLFGLETSSRSWGLITSLYELAEVYLVLLRGGAWKSCASTVVTTGRELSDPVL